MKAPPRGAAMHTAAASVVAVAADSSPPARRVSRKRSTKIRTERAAHTSSRLSQSLPRSRNARAFTQGPTGP